MNTKNNNVKDNSVNKNNDDEIANEVSNGNSSAAAVTRSTLLRKMYNEQRLSEM